MQSIIVTGAASGIGREISLQLAASGGSAYTVGGRVMDYFIRLVSELSASSIVHRLLMPMDDSQLVDLDVQGLSQTVSSPLDSFAGLRRANPSCCTCTRTQRVVHRCMHQAEPIPASTAKLARPPSHMSRAHALNTYNRTMAREAIPKPQLSTSLCCIHWAWQAVRMVWFDAGQSHSSSCTPCTHPDSSL